MPFLKLHFHHAIILPLQKLKTASNCPQLAAWTRERWAKSARMSQDSTLVPGLPFGSVQLSNLTFQGQDEMMSEVGGPGVWSTLLSIYAGPQQPH